MPAMDDRASTLVAIPWQGSCPHRCAALSWVLRQWSDTDYRINVGTSGEDTWVKARAVDVAIAGVQTDVLIVADADVWTTGVGEAVDAVRAGAPWAIPHDMLYRLTPGATARVLAGEPPSTALPTVEPPYGGRPGGGVVVLRRDVYEQCPIDPRFRGWGHEDEAWALALTALFGEPVRLDHPMWHLWHPPQPRISRGLGSAESEQLYRRYSKAARHPDLMRSLLSQAAEVAA
jgi:hypothetical protein